MSYATLMVHLDLDRPNAGLLAIAGDMADRFHSRVPGILDVRLEGSRLQDKSGVHSPALDTRTQAFSFASGDLKILRSRKGRRSVLIRLRLSLHKRMLAPGGLQD